MEQSKFLRFLLFLHFLIGVVSGLELLFMRDMLGELVATNFADQGWMVMGAAYLGLGVMSLVAYKTKTWEGAKAVVMGEIVFLAAALVALYMWHQETYDVSVFIMANGGAGVFLLVGFIYAYCTHCKK